MKDSAASTAQLQAERCLIGLPASYQPFAVCEGPLAESMRMIATQERALLVQASRCRVALSRLDMLQMIMASCECSAKEQAEVERWKASSVTMQTQLNKYLGTTAVDLLQSGRPRGRSHCRRDLADLLLLDQRRRIEELTVQLETERAKNQELTRQASSALSVPLRNCRAD